MGVSRSCCMHAVERNAKLCNCFHDLATGVFWLCVTKERWVEKRALRIVYRSRGEFEHETNTKGEENGGGELNRKRE